MHPLHARDLVEFCHALQTGEEGDGAQLLDPFVVQQL